MDFTRQTQIWLFWFAVKLATLCVQLPVCVCVCECIYAYVSGCAWVANKESKSCASQAKPIRQQRRRLRRNNKSSSHLPTTVKRVRFFLLRACRPYSVRTYKFRFFVFFFLGIFVCLAVWRHMFVICLSAYFVNNFDCYPKKNNVKKFVCVSVCVCVLICCRV